MNGPVVLDALPLSAAALLILEKLWKLAMVERFFHDAPVLSQQGSIARERSVEALSAAPLVSILQPILSGDATLALCLERNLQFACSYRREMIWLVDDDDAEAHRICRDLISRYPDSDIHVIQTPAPPDGASPKTFKLIIGTDHARGSIVCVLDDDTILPDMALETCLPSLEQPEVGLAFGLPYYVNFSNLWSSLVACFVNSHSLLTYVPVTYLTEPFTINGMFYAVKRTVLDNVGGFRGLESELMDDFAVAQRFIAHGLRPVQTRLMHGISTRVDDMRHYFRILHRWFIFPRETVLKVLPFKQLAIAYGMGLGSAVGPLALIILALLRPGWVSAGSLVLYVLINILVQVRVQYHYLPSPTPPRAFGWIPVIQFLLPFQILAALISPPRIEWRGHLMQIEPGGKFRFVKRRSECASKPD